MKYLNKQEIFDKVATHLLTQGKVSANYYGICLYRGPNGLKCAIGALIKDEFYDSEIEQDGVLGLAFMPLMASGVNVENEGIADFCSRLQNIHDYGNGSGINFVPHDLPTFWRNELRILAKEYKLDDKVLNQPLTTNPT